MLVNNDMKKVFFWIISVFFINIISFAQSEFNLDFEKIDYKTNKPAEWNISFTEGGAYGYQTNIDSIIRRQGKYSLTISIDSLKSNRTFGACSYTIPAIYEGSKIKLTGFLKTENISVDGFAGLWLRIDGQYGMIDFDNMRKSKIIGSNEWHEYAIELPLNDEAEKIQFGGLMVGETGRIWIDGLKLYIDGQKIENAKLKKEKVYKAKLDTSFTTQSRVSFLNVSGDFIANMQLLGQIWGFLKYNHPAIRQGNYNWDFELFKFLPYYLEANSNQSRDELLVDWINKLGKLDVCQSCVIEVNGDFKLKPDYRWIKDNTLSPELTMKLENVIKAKKSNKNYYVSFWPNVGNPIFDNEDPYEDIKFPDDGFRILALYRYWNIIQYFYPYRYGFNTDWNEVLVEFLPKFIEVENELDYRLVILELIGMIHDSHATLSESDRFILSFKGKLIPPIQTKFIENQLVITNYYDFSLAKDTRLEIGDIILKVDNVDIIDIVDEKIGFYPASNHATKLRNLAKDILRGNSEEVELLISRDNQLYKKTLKRYPLKSINTSIDWRHHSYSDSCYSFVDENIGYIDIGNIKNNLLPKIFDAFEDTRGIIIDLRSYQTEFVVFELSKYLLSEEKEFVKLTKGDLLTPGLFHWTPPISVRGESNEFYQGMVVILVNEVTQSHSEYTAMALKTSERSIVVGNTTAGADGNVSAIPLPGNVITWISGIGIYYPDGKETQRVGIVPDIVVNRTIKGVRENKDEVLQKAIEIINNGSYFKK